MILLEKTSAGETVDRDRSFSNELELRQRLLRAVIACAVCTVVSLAFFELCSRFFAFCVRPSVSRSQLYDQKFLVANQMQPSKHYIVLMGNSMMNRGVYPELLTALLRKKNLGDVEVINLALDGGDQADAIRYLDFLLNRNIKPALLIYNFDVEVLRPNANPLASFQDKTYLYRELLRSPNDPRRKFIAWCNENITLLRYREQYKIYLSEFFTHCFDLPTFNNSLYRDLNDGSLIEVSHAGNAPSCTIDDPRDPHTRGHFADHDFEISPKRHNFDYDRHAYDLIVGYSDHHSIPLLMVWMPTIRSAFEKRFFASAQNEQQIISDFRAYDRYKFVHTELFRDFSEEPIYYEDYRHLNEYGSVKFTETLAEYIGSHPKVWSGN